MSVYDGFVTLANSAEHAGAREKMLRAEYAKALHDREHYWVASFVYKVVPPLQVGQAFDFENLRSGPAVFCYICEEPYWPDVDPVCVGEVNSGVAPFWTKEEE